MKKLLIAALAVLAITSTSFSQGITRPGQKQAAQINQAFTTYVINGFVTGVPYTTSATINPTTAATPVTLVPDSAIPAGKKLYINGWRVNVTGTTAWSGGSFSALSIQDTNGTPVVGASIAVAGLTSNALLAATSANVTNGTAYLQNTGFTTAKGLVVTGNAVATAGSPVVVTVYGIIK